MLTHKRSTTSKPAAYKALLPMLAAAALSACSSGGAQPFPASGHPPASSQGDDGGNGSGGGEDAGASDLAMNLDSAGPADLRSDRDLTTPPDLGRFMGTINVKIFASNTCKISTDPASIAMPAGSTFTVNWINQASSSYEVDVAKRDPFNLVPILIGLEIGNSYHDMVHSWCGPFTGTFWFRISTACDQYEIPVDCNH